LFCIFCILSVLHILHIAHIALDPSGRRVTVATGVTQKTTRRRDGAEAAERPTARHPDRTPCASLSKEPSGTATAVTRGAGADQETADTRELAKELEKERSCGRPKMVRDCGQASQTGVRTWAGTGPRAGTTLGGRTTRAVTRPDSDRTRRACGPPDPNLNQTRIPARGRRSECGCSGRDTTRWPARTSTQPATGVTPRSGLAPCLNYPPATAGWTSPGPARQRE
jgi:hypothetical protein